MRFKSKEPWQEWTSLDFFPKNQYEAWNSALNDSHLKWSLDKSQWNHFYGVIRMQHLGGIRLLYCDCIPCSGKRTPSDIKKSHGEYYGLLFIFEGSEIIEQENHVIKLNKNNFMIWDSTKPIRFELLSKTKKVTLLVPQDRLRVQFPKVDQIIGKSIDFTKGLGALMASHIYSLVNEANSISNGTGDSVVDLTLELVTTCLQADMSLPITKTKKVLIDDIIKFIHRNLENPELGPSLIADSFNISTRYLHMLFSYKGVTVNSWIIDRRLEQCRRQLVKIDNYKNNVTNIAFKWGFNDSSHFSRVFKRKYGISPSKYRKRHFNLYT